LLTQSSLLDQMIDALSSALDPSAYIASIAETPFDWQHESLDPGVKRMMLLCARQSGKSTVVAGKATNKAKYNARSLNIITSPTEKQSQETMKKVNDYIAADPELNSLLRKDSAFEKEFGNGSRIIALPGTEKSVRGYSGPKTIILDEAAQMEDATYKAIRPMLTGNKEGELILLSTPFGKRGFFYNEWTKNPIWKKILVKPRWDLVDDKFVETMPEKKFVDYWREKGVSAYYSPRHEIDWLYEELLSIGPIGVRREYGCEFMDDQESMFSMSLIESAMTDDITAHYEAGEVQSAAVKVVDFFDDLWGK